MASVIDIVKDYRPEGLAGLHLPPELKFDMPEDETKWVRRPAGHLMLPLFFDLSGGVFVNILKYPKNRVIGRHVHDGPVFSYTIQGAWGYLEHDWTARAGTFLWEPPGEHHTLVMKEDDTMAFYVTHGGLTSLDENDKPIRVDNALTMVAACDEYYRANGFGEDYIKQFIR